MSLGVDAMGDRYTKFVLTVIALALVCLVGQSATKSAQAQSSGPVHVIVDSVASYALQYAGPLTVHPQ